MNRQCPSCKSLEQPPLNSAVSAIEALIDRLYIAGAGVNDNSVPSLDPERIQADAFREIGARFLHEIMADGKTSCRLRNHKFDLIYFIALAKMKRSKKTAKQFHDDMERFDSDKDNNELMLNAMKDVRSYLKLFKTNRLKLSKSAALSNN